jgi:chemotaxis protein MotB
VSSDEKKHEIVIIRRGGHGHEEGHHGGMWKIAYADFMTAMMALFLVLWLVNSSDEKTLAQVAAYFNPIELSDNTTMERGVQDKNQAGSGTTGDHSPAQSGNTKDTMKPRNIKERSGVADEQLFSDPYDVLTKIAAKAARLPSPNAAKGEQSSGGPNAAGEAFRDPFDPDFRFNSKAEDSGLSGSGKGEGDKQANLADAKPEDKRAAKVSDMPLTDNLAKEVDKAALQAEKAARDANAGAAADTKEVKDIKSELAKDIRSAGLTALPDISVKQTSEGILISLTDQANFEMFALSSAEPKPELVVLMEKLATVLAKQPGDIIISGHTDARPFRSKTYDNWRLSTARAHIAQYMLTLGGFPKDRIDRIEGYADHQLKDPKDPLAAQNRRIEILLKPKPA